MLSFAIQKVQSRFQRRKLSGSFVSLPDHFSGLPERNSKRLAPVSVTQSDAVYFYPSVGRSVSGLTLGSCPSAIFLAVITIVVDPIYRISLRRSWTHILKKIRKAFKPSIAYLNTSSTISRIFGRFRVITTSLHQRPNTPFWGSAFAMKAFTQQPVNFQAGCRAFTLQTSTTAVGSAKISRRCDNHAAAVALTLPHHISSARNLGAAHSHQPSKSLALNIKRFRHFYDPLLDTYTTLGYKVNA